MNVSIVKPWSKVRTSLTQHQINFHLTTIDSESSLCLK